MFRKFLWVAMTGVLVLAVTQMEVAEASNRPRHKSKTVKQRTKSEKNSTSVEIEYWNSIKSSQNPKDFEAYLADFPKGHFRRLAENKLDELAPPAPPVVTPPPSARNEELDSWNTIKNSTDPESFRAFLQKYPNGMCALLAKSRLKKLTEKPGSTPVIRSLPAGQTH
ncbi:MAG: hypothetical protein K1Y36_13830 [Blastocatellia bacterium]|nr:hypothetical protein [Blastocatellia bacterium]